MKISLSSRYAKLVCWHSWFVWHPVCVAPNEWRWLEIVERKGTLMRGWGDQWWSFEYREASHAA